MFRKAISAQASPLVTVALSSGVRLSVFDPSLATRLVDLCDRHVSAPIAIKLDELIPRKTQVAPDLAHSNSGPIPVKPVDTKAKGCAGCNQSDDLSSSNFESNSFSRAPGGKPVLRNLIGISGGAGKMQEFSDTVCAGCNQSDGLSSSNFESNSFSSALEGKLDVKNLIGNSGGAGKMQEFSDTVCARCNQSDGPSSSNFESNSFSSALEGKLDVKNLIGTSGGAGKTQALLNSGGSSNETANYPELINEDEEEEDEEEENSFPSDAKPADKFVAETVSEVSDELDEDSRLHQLYDAYEEYDSDFENAYMSESEMRKLRWIT